MGSGSYTSDTFRSYASTKGFSYDSMTSKLSSSVKHQDIFKSTCVDPSLDPRNITVRECCDSEEHPETKPVILALDVTGSMGDAATETASSLGVIMTNLYEKVKDIQFMTMGIGDFAYDRSPLQVSQFESDVRINEQLDKIYFEFGGGGNRFESYTAAWKFALDRTKIDCYIKRGKKGTLITIGDEMINPYISSSKWEIFVGDKLQDDIETAVLYDAIIEKYNVYHIHICHGSHFESYDDDCVNSFSRVIGRQHVFKCKVSEIDEIITNIVLDSVDHNDAVVAPLKDSADKNAEGEIIW